MLAGPAAGPEGGHPHALAGVIRGMAVALLGGVLGGGLGFVFTVVMARLLAQDEFGLLVLTLNLLASGAALAVWGFDFATIRYVAAADSPGSKRGAMLMPLALVTALNVVVAGLLLAFAEPLAADVLQRPELVGVLRSLALVLPLTVAAQMLSAALSGLEQARGELARKLVERGGRIVLCPLGLALGLGLVGVVLGMAVAAALAALVVGVLLLRSLPRGGPTVPLAVGKVVRFAWPQAVSNLTRELWMLAVVLTLLRSTDARTVALYGAAVTVSALPLLIYNAFAFRFSPTISRLWERGDHGQLEALLKGVTRWTAISSLPFFAVAIVLPAPLLEIFGANYREAALALSLVAVGTLITSLTGPVERALIMSGRVQLEMRATLLSALVTLALMLVLIPVLGLLGAAILRLTYSIVLNGLKAYLVWRTMRIHTFSPALLRPLAAAALAALAVALVGALTDIESSLAGSAGLAVAFVAVYAVLLLRVFGISPADRAALALALRPAP